MAIANGHCTGDVTLVAHPLGLGDDSEGRKLGRARGGWVNGWNVNRWRDDDHGTTLLLRQRDSCRYRTIGTLQA